LTKDYLLVDGYNIIFAWKDLKELADTSLEAARVKLADILCNFQGFKKNEIILVFDGYKSKGNAGSVIHYNNIDIVYTKEATTADQFIEAVSQQMARDYRIRVATSDGLEQMIILARGASRISARELRREIKDAEKEIKSLYEAEARGKRNLLMDNLPPEMAQLLEKMRLGE
jgi:predicted RNA-binding protein with PIN domain